ncbi:MAG: hypothetical protein B6D61_02385, partial [Bacteroidetes bacterium 4484_249]
MKQNYIFLRNRAAGLLIFKQFELKKMSFLLLLLFVTALVSGQNYPPVNVAATAFGNDVIVTWNPPSNMPDEWIQWDNGINDGDGIGLISGGTFYTASHWFPVDLAPYNGQTLTQVAFFADGDPAAVYEIMVWTGPDAETLVSTELVSGFTVDDWNEITLSTPVTIDASQEFWFGYSVTHSAGTHPAGKDAGPAIATKGDMISLDGINWVSMSNEYGLDFNWNIAGFVQSTDAATPAKPLVKQLPDKISKGSFVTGQGTGVAKKFIPSKSKDLLGYNIYRNTGFLDYTTNLTYLDENVEDGTYEYCVTAVYDDGESICSNSDIVNIGTANCEFFDDLTVGGLVAGQLGGMWTTWSGSSTNDATVSNIYSNSPNNSFVIDEGTDDLVFMFADEPITTGEYIYSHYMYVPTGFSGYFNFQSEPTPGVGWVCEIFFDDNGTGHIDQGYQNPIANFDFDFNTWIFVEINFNLDTDTIEISMDNELIVQFSNPEETIGGIDYYGSDSGGTPGTYFDDVCFSEALPAILDNDIAIIAITTPISGYELGNNEEVSVIIENLGSDPQSNFDVYYTLDGGAQVVETVTTTLNFGESLEYTFATTIDLSTFGAYSIEACANLSGDENTDNDCQSVSVENIEPDLCTDGLYSSGCNYGDGLTTWDLSDVNGLTIACDGDPYPWYHDFRYIMHSFDVDTEYTLTAQCGFNNTYLKIWIDYNNDYILDNDEIIVDNFPMLQAGIDYSIPVIIPADAVEGSHVMRYRTNRNSPITGDACETLFSGNMADFRVHIGDFENDLKITAITAPVSGIDLGNAEFVKVIIENNGTATQSNFDVYYTVNDSSQVTETVTETLNAGETMEYTFATTVDISAYGVYNIETCVALTGDENPSNNCTYVSVSNSSVPLNYLGKSGNIFSELYASQQTVNYDPASNLITMSHRADPATYPDALGNNSSIVCSQSIDGGQSWSYKMLWPFDGTNSTRYPQGFIYNVDNYSNPESVIIGAAGPSHSGGNWNNNFFASATNDAVLSGQTATFNTMECSYEPYTHGTAVTDNGYVYIGGWCPNEFKIKRAAKDGNHIDFDNANTYVVDVSAPTTYWLGEAGMAWAYDGSVGYVFGIGVMDVYLGQTAYSPVVWKSEDNGETWDLITVGMSMVDFPGLENDLVLSDDGHYVPLFETGSNSNSGDYKSISGIVDANGDLQFFGRCISGYSLNNYSTPSPNDNNYKLFNVTINKDNGITAYHNIGNFLSEPVTSSTYEYYGFGWGHRMQASRSEDGTVFFITWADTPESNLYSGQNAQPDLYIWGSYFGYTNPAPPTRMTYDGVYWFHYVSGIAMHLNGNSYKIPITKTITQEEMTNNTSDIDPVTIEFVDDMIYDVPYGSAVPEITQQPQGVNGCVGDSLLIDVEANNVESYQWYKDGAILTGETNNFILFNPAEVSQSGAYYCVLTNVVGSINTNIANVIVMNYPTPEISGNTNICEGESTILDAGPGYSSYLWQDGSDTQTITVTEEGVYSVTVTNNAGCEGSDEVSVIVSPLPETPAITADVTELCEGETATISVNDPQSGVTYHW